MTHLSFTQRRWLLPSDGDTQYATGIDGAVQQLLAQRGAIAYALESVAAYAAFFPDLSAAIERLHRAIASKERVLVFGDYDCDGITSAVQVIRLLQRHGLQPLVRLPHRIQEGYGLRVSHIDEAQRSGATLIITVDTGIAALEAAARAMQAGIDLIILDHHHFQEELPQATAIVHPGLAPNFPGAHPAAAGVTYLFVHAFEVSLATAQEKSFGDDHWVDHKTDEALAALGTVADLVPLSGVNRLLTINGLRAMHALASGPLVQLMDRSGLRKDGKGVSLTSRDLAFRLAPRINAAGRMADPMIALHALLGDEHALEQLEALNRERQAIVASHMEEALLLGESDSPFLFLAKPEYSPGIVGLIAGKLTEMFGKPSFVGAVQGDVCVGSLRSIPGYHITEALARGSEHLLNFGGHAQAAGCQLARESLGALRAHLEQDAAVQLDHASLVPTLPLDAVLPLHAITHELLSVINALEPFGQGNPEPRFLMENVALTDVRRVGADGSHLQARAGAMKMIGFGLGHLCDQVLDRVDLAGRIGMNEFRGTRSMQIFLDDVRLAAKLVVCSE